MRHPLRVSALLSSLLLAAAVALGDGSEAILTTSGCYGIATYGLGMYGDGNGAATITVSRPILGAFLHWVGVEDETPPGPGTSTLKVNGTDVVGTPNTPPADFNPSFGWRSWWASIGPASGPFPGLGLVDDLNRSVDVQDWDTSGFPASNGATVTVIYDPGPCSTPRDLEIQMGVDWYFHGTPGEPWTDLLVFDFPASPIDRVVTFHVAHAGTDAGQSSCRGGAAWMAAGTGPAPAPTALDLLDRDPGSGRGFGINGGVEVANDIFTSASLPCTPALNPVPDQPYAPGHPCPLGGSSCPYRGLALRPPAGGDVGAEWGVIEIDVLIPAGSTWVAFQLESEADQSGESGSWAGASFVLAQLGACGDGVLDPGEECDDGNRIDGDGCDSNCRRECATLRPPDLTCVDREACNTPGACSAPIACEIGVAVGCDPDGDPLTFACSPASPYPLGRTDVTVTVSDGTTSVAKVCPVAVRDCEPPACTAPPDLALECSARGGVPAGDLRIQALLAAFTDSDNCAIRSRSSHFPPLFPAGCAPGAATAVGRHVIDTAGYQAFCSARVVVVDTTPPTIACPPPLILECSDPGGVMADDPRILAWLRSASAADVCGVAVVTHDAPSQFPSGCGAGQTTTVTFRATDDCGSSAVCTSSVTVTEPEPRIETCGDTEACLWPPNHKYVCFDNVRARFTVTAPCADPGPTVEISCRSSQCDDAPCPEHPGENGDGRTIDDCIYDAATDTLCARAERAGTDQAGRFYSVTAVITTRCGSTAPIEVLSIHVPHDQGHKAPCLAPPLVAEE